MINSVVATLVALRTTLSRRRFPVSFVHQSCLYSRFTRINSSESTRILFRIILSPQTILPIVNGSLHQQCWFSSLRSKNKRPDPFKVLGVKRGEPYAKAKANFIEIAMSHHPDTSQAANEKERNEFREIFIRARRAFEQLTEGQDGEIVLKKEKKEMEDFDAWFKNETGHDTPFQFMDAETMKEVAEMEDTVGHGLDRDGGMWMLASMVSNAVKRGQSGESILRIEAGEVQEKNAQIDGLLRRKRKRRR